MTVGTQAAFLAGVDITMFIEFSPPTDDQWLTEYVHVAMFLRGVYYAVIVGAFCANMLVVSHTTALSVLGAGMALRGPDGSMITATDGLYEERKAVFHVFGIGLALTIGSVLISVWLLLRWETALVCWIVTLITIRKMFVNYQRVMRRFDFDENDTVDFSDIMNGPAAIMAVPSRHQVKPRKKFTLMKAPSSPELGFDHSENSDLEMQPLPTPIVKRRGGRLSTRSPHRDVI
jgi:hypothetical protein